MGGGKSAWMVNEAIQLSLDFPGNRGYLCRYESVTFDKTTLLTLQKFLPEEIISNHNKSKKFYELKNGSVIYYGGLKGTQSDKPFDRIKSMELGWFGIDEATELPNDEYFLILLSRLRHRTPDGKLVRYKGLLASNPEPGWVRTKFIDDIGDNYRFVSALPRENPHNPEDYEQSLRDNFPSEWVDKYLEGSWDVMLKGMYVFPYEWVKMAAETKLARGEPCEFGVDVAREGGDENAVACRWGNRVNVIYTSSFQKTMKTAGEIAVLIDRDKPSKVRVDTVGVGGGVHDRLEEQEYPVEEFKAGSKPGDPEKYFNLKAEVYWKFRELLEKGLVDIDNDPKLIAQFAAVQYDVQSDKRIKIWSKDKMKGKGLKSPDRAEAVITAFFGKAQEAKEGGWRDYFSTHPNTKERLKPFEGQGG